MHPFTLYFRLGIEHITDLAGYDHILFVTALCAVYSLRQWRQVVWLVTAFTLGHTVSLALATLQVVTVDTAWVEFLIPVTIVLTCLGNYFAPDGRTDWMGRPLHGARRWQLALKYALTVAFGLIHGLGFSNYLRSLLGRETSLWDKLLAFNLGLEAGQLAIVAAVLLLSSVFAWKPGNGRREWNLVVSAAVAALAMRFVVERWPG